MLILFLYEISELHLGCITLQYTKLFNSIGSYIQQFEFYCHSVGYILVSVITVPILFMIRDIFQLSAGVKHAN